MTKTIPVPSFRRQILKRDYVEEVTESEKKVREFKYKKEEVYTVTKVTKLMIFISCGHTYYAGNLIRDNHKSMDCYQCECIWQQENNCNWMGEVNET